MGGARPRRRQRRLVASTCARRAALELQGAAAFTVVTGALFELRADAAIVELSARAIAEELRHSEIYRALASDYAGSRCRGRGPRPFRRARAPGRRARAAAGAARRRHVRDQRDDGLRLPRAVPRRRDRAAVRARGCARCSPTRSATGASAGPGSARWARPEARGDRALRAADAARAAGRMARADRHAARRCRARASAVRRAAAIEEATVRSIGELVLPGFEHLGMDVTLARAWLAAGARD